MSKSQHKIATNVSGKMLELGRCFIRTFNPNEAINNICDVVKSISSEKTKRVHIEAWRQQRIEELNSYREVLMKYLDHSFDERKHSFKCLFSTLDKEIEHNNIQSISCILGAIVELGRSSPFKDLASVSHVRNMLNNPDVKIEF